jgi:hypothetical protein
VNSGFRLEVGIKERSCRRKQVEEDYETRRGYVRGRRVGCVRDRQWMRTGGRSVARRIMMPMTWGDGTLGGSSAGGNNTRRHAICTAEE